MVADGATNCGSWWVNSDDGIKFLRPIKLHEESNLMEDSNRVADIVPLCFTPVMFYYLSLYLYGSYEKREWFPTIATFYYD